MGVSARVSADLGLVRDERFAELCRSRPQDFTRRRKLPREDLVGSVLARRGRSLGLELRQLGRELGMAEPISRPGYLRARAKLNPAALRELAAHHAAGVYADGDHREYKGMVVVAVDGSSANVPTTPETLALWGTTTSSGRPQATMGISAAYDPLTRQLLDAELRPCGFDERGEVMGHLEAARRVTGGARLLVVLDRGYQSLALMSALDAAGHTYVARCSSTFLGAEFAACEAAGGDLLADVEATRARLRRVAARDPGAAERMRAEGGLRVRLVSLDVGGPAPERLATNAGPGLLSPAELAEVYRLRWGVETCFEFMKDRLQLENFTGSSPRLVEQDFWATAYLLNVAFDLANEAEAGLGAPAGAHAMAVNRTLAMGALKEELYALLLADDAGREEIMGGLVAELGRSLVPVRPGRGPYPRDGLGRRRARKYNNSHRRAF